MTSHEKHACLRMIILGSGCDSVGRAVASDTRGLQFESSHRQILYYLYTVNCIEIRKLRKRCRDWPIFRGKNNFSVA